MNIKTTLSMALTLMLLVAALFFVRSNASSATSNLSTTSIPSTNLTARDLIEEKPGDIVKVVARRKDKEDWVFEKIEPESGGAAVWHMTSPEKIKVVPWEVDKFGRQLGNIQYQISYRPGQAGAVSAAAAGLEPPEAIVELTDADGKNVSVEIGLPASAETTYVRLAGDNSIYVGQSQFRSLFKSYPMAYREKSVWSFDQNDVTRVEIIELQAEGSPVTYTFSRSGARWMMETPTSARATEKVTQAMRAISNLRALEWMDTHHSSLASFGLEPAPLVVRITVEKNLPVESDQEDEEAEAAVKTETKITTYVLRVSDRSPIGEDTKTYISMGDASAVATVMKTTTDKLKPDMKQWRDMKVVTTNVTGATRMDINYGKESFTLIKTVDKWDIEGSGLADEAVVMKLLNAINEMEAVAHVEADDATLTTMGFDKPQLNIRLTVPGVEGVERFTVGGFTDPNTRRLVYLRRNESNSISKIRTGSINALLKNRLAFRDRTIIDLPQSRIKTLTLVTRNSYKGRENNFTFQRQDGEWKMSDPVDAPVNMERMTKLIRSLSSFKGESIVSETEDELAAYGLHQPSATLSLAEISDDSSSAEKTVTVSLSQKDGRYFAHRSGRPVIYQVRKEIYDQLLMEYREAEIFSFEDNQVQEFSVRSQDQKHIFDKQSDEWVYQLEPDLPLDSKKVLELLLRIRDLKTDRFVIYGLDNPDDLGLSNPRHEITVTLDDGTAQTLLIADKLTNIGSNSGYFAMLEDHDEVFLVSADTLQRFAVSLPELEQ